jgi:hypothetical protein
MTLSILLTTPWDSKTLDTPPQLEVPKVRPHRFSWKSAGTVGFPRGPWGVNTQRWGEHDELVMTDEAEVITSESDEGIFRKIHGLTASEARYDELAEGLAAKGTEGIIDVIKEMAFQHPDAMWFVRRWSVEAAAID